ncbi:hypothetical protein SUGI_0308530 [Cryptomeria japonica]|nr:hypothetical protein SUGI_0308530 [Cryptomeria japonica]
MASEERRVECERQRAKCEAQKEDFDGCSMEGNSQQQTNDREKGIAKGKGKEQPTGRQTPGNNDRIAEGKDNTPNQSLAEESIIARIIGPKKSRQSINPWIKENWGNQVVVKFIPKGFFVAIFTEKEIRDQILNSKNWFFYNLPIYIQPWTPNFNPTTLAVYETLVWIRLFNLPIEYWGDQCLEKIGRTLSTLLEIDEEVIESDSYIYARMKIVVVEQIPPHINLRTANGIWKQGIEIEKELSVCQRCGSKTRQTKRCRMFVRRAFNTKQRTEDKEKALWLRKMNEQKQRPTATSDSLSDTSKHPKLYQKESETNKGEGMAIPSQETSPITGSQAVNIIKECTSDANMSNSDREGEDDVLDNLDPICISQSANTLLGRAKGFKGRKSNKQIRKEKASEKGIVSILEYMKNSKGGSPSLGQK